MPTNTLPATVEAVPSIDIAEKLSDKDLEIRVESLKKTLTKDERKELGMLTAGLTDERLFKTAVDGLDAMSVMVDKYGEEHSSPDHNVRHKFLDTLLRVKGYIRPDASIDNTMNFNLTVTERVAIKTRLVKGMGRGKVIDV